MVEVVVVKKIGKYEICLRKTDILEFQIRWAIIGLIIITCIVLLVEYMTYLLNSPQIELLIVGTMLWCGLVGLSHMLALFDKIIPAYSVSCKYFDSEVIRKTNVEDDQIAICKAVKRMEQRILNKVEEGSELETIASKCG